MNDQGLVRGRGLIANKCAAATEAASLAAARQKNGRPVDLRDTQIAGIALARRATFATRNVRHFRDLKILIVDPWAAQNV
jgi:predicted nucleic acid-binding protein